MMQRSGYGFIYDARRSIYTLFTFISILGSLMVIYYLEKLEKEPKCEKLSPKLFDFVKKYNFLILVSSLASIIFMWAGVM